MNKVHRNGRASLHTTLAATLALAIAFIVSCSGYSEPSNSSGTKMDSSNSLGSNSSSSSVEISSSSEEQSSSSLEVANSSSSVQGSSSVGCEDIVFNPLTSFCYEDNVYSKCNGMVYNPATHICQGIVANPAKCDGIQYNPLTQRCTDGVVETKCGANWYNATNANLRCESDVVETKCGTNSWYDDANTNLRCENNIVETRCGANWYNAEKILCSNGTPFMTDSRDNQTYKIVTIGTQTWMAQNLNYKTSSSICYNNSEANCAIYGRLYSDVMIGNVCPSGWHLPSNTDWDKLLNFVNPDCPSNVVQPYCVGVSCANAGTKLKATSGWNVGIAGTDDFGFAALPGGTSYNFGYFEGIGTNGIWWSATIKNGDQCEYRMHEKDWGNIGASNLLRSVRCIKD